MSIEYGQVSNVGIKTVVKGTACILMRVQEVVARLGYRNTPYLRVKLTKYEAR